MYLSGFSLKGMWWEQSTSFFLFFFPSTQHMYREFVFRPRCIVVRVACYVGSPSGIQTPTSALAPSVLYARWQIHQVGWQGTPPVGVTLHSQLGECLESNVGRRERHLYVCKPFCIFSYLKIIFEICLASSSPLSVAEGFPRLPLNCETATRFAQIAVAAQVRVNQLEELRSFREVHEPEIRPEQNGSD